MKALVLKLNIAKQYMTNYYLGLTIFNLLSTFNTKHQLTFDVVYFGITEDRL